MYFPGDQDTLNFLEPGYGTIVYGLCYALVVDEDELCGIIILVIVNDSSLVLESLIVSVSVVSSVSDCFWLMN